MPNVYDPADLAVRWNVSLKTVYRMLEAGKLRGFKVGTQWRITETEVKRKEESHG